ncbi:MAG: PaaI family thioesterase [Deltaproteobacteria bacterium]|nr:PaaI family thioesterase [Deltaproteobacteria bacterium]
MEQQDFSEAINTIDDGWVRANGLRFTRATLDEVTAELTVRPEHLQAYGLVHGGVHASIVETVASVGAAINVMPHGLSAVGLDNHTSFLHAVRGGVLRAVGRPLTRGRRSQLWEVTISDDTGRVAATGRVRLLVLDNAAQVAGGGLTVSGLDKPGP